MEMVTVMARKKDESAQEVALVNLKVPHWLRDDFRIAAQLEGMDVSAMLRNFMIRTVREAKENYPEAFAAKGKDDEKSDRGLARRLDSIIDNWSRLTDQKAKQDMLEMFEIIQNENKQTNRRERGTKRA